MMPVGKAQPEHTQNAAIPPHHLQSPGTPPLLPPNWRLDEAECGEEPVGLKLAG